MRALVASLVLLVGCSWPEHEFASIDAAPLDDGSLDSTSEAAVDATVDAPETAVIDTGPADTLAVDDAAGLPDPMQCPPEVDRPAPCDPLRNFPGTWTIDGDAREFCRDEGGVLSTPPRRFAFKDAARVTPPDPPGLAENVEVRAGLSAYGIHVFVQVLGDPRVLVNASDLVQGDAIELFLRGDKAPTGKLSTDDAQHLVFTPPTATGAGYGAYYVDGKRAGAIPNEHWRTRRVKGGFELELAFPWTLLKNQPTPGSHVGFDVAIDLDDDPTVAGRSARAIMTFESVTGATSCGSAPLDPACDDRTWCLARAY